MPTPRLATVFPLLAACLGIAPLAAAEPAAAIDFTRDIRPILSNHCWSCHGPDEAARESGLRLDQRAAATGKAESGAIAIVPGNPAASELVARIESGDDEVVMPPKSTQKPLSADQMALLKRWIAGGAEYAAHWAFIPP